MTTIIPRTISARNKRAPRDTATITGVESFLSSVSSLLLGAEAGVVDAVGRRKKK